MAADRPPLTARQLAVLQWIAAGCPDGVWPDHTHKLLVGRLETLNLASVRRWYGKWRAVIQPDGEYYLQHGRYPGDTPSAGSEQSAWVVGEHTVSCSPTVPAERRRLFKEPSPTAQLVARIVAAGGTLTLSPDDPVEHRRLKLQIDAAQRHGKTPAGMQLVVERPSWSTFVLTLAEIPAWMAEPVAEIAVPTQLRRPHDAVAALRADERLLAIHGAAQRRALLLLQALVEAATMRGHRVTAGTMDERYGRRQPTRTHLMFTVAGHQVGLRVIQLNERTDHVPTAKELADKQRYSFYSIPRYDYTPGDRLKIEIIEHGSGSWTDGTRKKLEDRLAEVLSAIERAADRAERARVAAAERRRQEQLDHERRVARATQRLVDSNRAVVLDEQVAAWIRARQLDDYVAAMTAVVEQIDDPEDGVAAAEWLDWIRQHARAIDPLKHPIAMPADPEPTPTALAPFMERPSYRW